MIDINPFHPLVIIGLSALALVVGFIVIKGRSSDAGAGEKVTPAKAVNFDVEPPF